GLDRVPVEVLGPPAHELDEILAPSVAPLLRYLGCRDPFEIWSDIAGLEGGWEVAALDPCHEGVVNPSDRLDVVRHAASRSTARTSSSCVFGDTCGIACATVPSGSMMNVARFTPM